VVIAVNAALVTVKIIDVTKVLYYPLTLVC